MKDDAILSTILSPVNSRRILSFFIYLFMITRNNICSGSPCNVDTTIETFREDVPPGTMILKIPYHEEETWEFRESYPEGYVEMETLESGEKIISFKRCPDLEEMNINNSQNSIIESLEYTLSCTFKGIRHLYKQRIALVDVNEKDPYFTQSQYRIQVNEMTLVGSPVFSLADKAADDDVTGTIALFRLHPFLNEKLDGRQKFSTSTLGKEIILKEALDHDKMRMEMEKTDYYLNISVQDNGYPTARITFTTLVIEVLDSDDQSPAFVYPNCPRVDHFCATPAFTAHVTENSTGFLKIFPAEIKAEDKDEQKNRIFYSIFNAEPPSFRGHFRMDNRTGRINQTFVIWGQRTISLVIKAEEISRNRRYITSTVLIKIERRSSRNKIEEINKKNSSNSSSEDETSSLSEWPNMDWAKGSVSVTIFFIVIGSLLLLLMGMMVAVCLALRDRKQRGPNITFDDSSSDGTGSSSSSLGSRDTVSTNDVCTNTDQSDIIEEGQEEGDYPKIGVDCYATPTTLGFSDIDQQIFDPTGTNSLPVSASSPKFGKAALKKDSKRYMNYQKKKQTKSLKLINMLTSSKRKTAKQKEMPGRYNFGIESHWLDMPYDFD